MSAYRHGRSRLIALSGAQPSLWRSTLPQHPDLAQIFESYVDPVYAFLYGHVGNREDAEDLTSEVFLKASRQLDTGREEHSVASWLFVVARNVLADHWRRYYRAGATVPIADDRVDRAWEGPEAEQTDQSERVARLLSELPERYRRVLELRFLRGYSVNEVAQEMGITPENAKVLQHRALAKAVQIDEGKR